MFKMCDRAALRNETRTCFNSIRLEEINKSSIDYVIENEYNGTEENEMITSILFSHDPCETFEKICSICEKWCEVPSNTSIDESFRSASGDSFLEEVLWTYLNSVNIEVRRLLVLIYLVATKAVKTSSSLKEKELGLCSAKLYFTFLKTPGSSAYSVFHHNLYLACVDCLQMPSYLLEATHPNEEQDAFTWEDFDSLLPTFISTLDSFVPLLSNFYLGSEKTIVEFTIKKLIELFACDGSNKELDFDVDFLAMSKSVRKRKYSPAYIVTSLVSQAMLQLARAEMNGKKLNIFVHILGGLFPHILCKKQEIPGPITQKVLACKDNAVAFIKYNLKHDRELFSIPIETTLRRLCMAVDDRIEIRSVIANAIFSIMFDLKNCDLVNFIEWLLCFVDSSETYHRAFAVEILGLLLREDLPEVDKNGLKSEIEIYFTPIPATYAILTRCDDITSVVRLRATCVMSHYTKKMLNSLPEFLGNSDAALAEKFEEEIKTDMNGEHRIFWYKFQSFREILNEIAALLHRRAEDPVVAVRRAVLPAIEYLIVFDPVYLTTDFLKLVESYAKDFTDATRKQVVQSLNNILDAYPSSSEAQDSWLKGVMPMVCDPDNSVQSEALTVMKDRFLNHFFSNNNTLKDCVLSLLVKLFSREYRSHQEYLRKCFSLWKRDKKFNFNVRNVGNLEKCLGLGKDIPIWFFLSVYSEYSKLPQKLTVKAVNEFSKSGNWKNYFFMEYILKIIGNILDNVSSLNLNMMKDTLTSKIRMFSESLEILPLMLEVLKKIHKQLNCEEDFSNFSQEIYQVCVNYFTKGMQRSKNKEITDELLAKCLTVVPEICHTFPNKITTELTDILKPYHSVGQRNKNISPLLRAHALSCIGKLAIQDDALAHRISPELAHDLINSHESVIRNNAVIVLINICMRYPSLAPEYIPIICRVGLKDRVVLIRYQTLIMLMNLLQEGYSNYEGTLFFCLLSTVIDKEESIQKLGKHCVGALLLEKKKSILSDHFVDSIFVFNGYEPPDNDDLSKLVQELAVFALKGKEKQEDRMQLYMFLLSYIEPVKFAFVVFELVQNILNAVADYVFPLTSATENMIRDCFAILSSNIYSRDAEDDEENEKSAIESQNEKNNRMIIMVKPVLPAVISLKNRVTAEKSALYEEIINFLGDFLSDYEDEMNELFVTDRMLRSQVKLRMTLLKIQRNTEVTEEKNKVPGKELVTSNKRNREERVANVTNKILQMERVANTQMKLQGTPAISSLVSQLDSDDSD